ncbi:energy transducer TonB [Pasteurellaceae bacterium HPA106]|uniref:energy transducer TonB family protein n=1 Tax=Spirabiliibacterium pneumoniae TaxID=221400 RepID=UPI001AAD44A9|nr:energy transducer TonB [Spirabiliibacterium pneumoniae]MBE2897256.1 energy transducer TonB [Spirabiliibacterium pneumoniae]
MKSRSLIGFTGSLLLHSALASAVIMALAKSDDQSINGVAVAQPSDSISMEMVMAMIEAQKQLEPEPEPAPVAEEEPEVQLEEPKEEVPDPTVAPKPIEKPKVEKKVEKPKPKPKPKPEPKPKKVTQSVDKKNKQKPQSAVSGERTVNSPNQANSHLAAGAKSSNQAVIGQGGAQLDDYRRQLRREIERNKRYSQRAKMMRQQGKVVIRFNLAPNGAIVGASVATSSGFSELDKLALQAVNAARPVGPRPAGLNGAITVPIDFTLR